MLSGRLLLSTLALLTSCAVLRADDLPPAKQREQQLRVQADVEQTARRVTTTLRVLAYQRLDPTAEQKVLDEVATGLRGLSRDQMAAVLAHLEAAVSAADEPTASAEQRAAYQKHRQVIASLRVMLSRLEILRSLDQAADRFSQYATQQHDLHLQSLANESRRRNEIDREEQSDRQADLRSELMNLMSQLAELRARLDPEKKDRLDRADAFGRGGQNVAQMEIARQMVLNGNFRPAAEKQLKTSQDLQALAAALRPRRDQAEALRELRDRVDNLLRDQQQLKSDTEQPPDLRRERFDRTRTDPKRAHANQLADRQSRLEFKTREVRRVAETIAREVEPKLNSAESEMRRAQSTLRSADLKQAARPEQAATDRLRETRDKLDSLIDQAEKVKSDPLEATRHASKLIEQLIKDQTAAKKLTEANAKKPDSLRPAIDSQRAVANKVREIQQLPLPGNDDASESLSRAAESSRSAADDLERKDALAAQPNQTETLDALKAAKKALDQQATAIEKRREDLAKLGNAIQKLDELTRKEKQLAEDAQTQADSTRGQKEPDTRKLARNQSELTPPTKSLGEQVRQDAPEAAQQIQEAARNQEAAREQLERDDAKSGAQQASEAAQKMAAARDELAKKAEAMRAQEIAEQTAMRPNKVDPAAAAQQIAKAIEQANQAATEANRAAKQLKETTKDDKPQPTPSDDLAQLQREVATQAKQLQQEDAQQAAAEAVQSLEKGDLPAALDHQRQALDALKKAAAQQPKAEQKTNQDGSPMPGQNKAPADLAGDQQVIMQATEALAKSTEATSAAQAALTQAQAQAPTSIQSQLEHAGKNLNQAQQELVKGQPSQAGQEQSEAASQLTKALSTLNAATAAMGQPGAEPGQNQQAAAKSDGQQPGDRAGRPGQQDSKNQQANAQQSQPGNAPGKKPGDGQEQNQGVSEGNRTGHDRMNKSAVATGSGASGDGAFINLQKQEREKVLQNSEAAFPAEFRELIKQYNINIKTNGQAQKPTAAEPSK